VSVRVHDDLAMLEKCLVETDPDTTEIVVVAAHAPPPEGTEGTDIVDAAPRTPPPELRLTDEDRRLMTAVVNRSELAGKPIKPMVVLTDEPIAVLVDATRALGARELILGSSDTEASDDAQLDQVASRWSDTCDARLTALTIRVIGKESDMRREIAGGGQIPSGPDDGETARSLAGSGSKVG
jgi:hypothetical protein